MPELLLILAVASASIGALVIAVGVLGRAIASKRARRFQRSTGRPVDGELTDAERRAWSELVRALDPEALP